MTGRKLHGGRLRSMYMCGGTCRYIVRRACSAQPHVPCFTYTCNYSVPIHYTECTTPVPPCPIGLRRGIISCCAPSVPIRTACSVHASAPATQPPSYSAKSTARGARARVSISPSQICFIHRPLIQSSYSSSCTPRRSFPSAPFPLLLLLLVVAVCRHF